MSTNNDKNGGDTPSDGGDITSTTSKIPPPREPGTDAHFEESGDLGGSGDGGDIFGVSRKDALEVLGDDNNIDINIQRR
jgi:hypothetical protein